MRIVAGLLIILGCAATPGHLGAQSAAKKVRLGIQSNNIGFLPFHLAYHKGYYREQGIELETIFMATQAVNTAFLRGEIDYSAAINGVIQGIVRGNAAKILACAVDRPLISLIARKEIRAAADLKGRKIGGSTPGGTASLMADAALKHLGLQAGRDMTIVALRDNRVAALESGIVDAALRALYFVLEPRNRDEVTNIVMKQWRLTDQRIATEMLRQFYRGMARDLMAKPEGMQLMIDLVREDSKVSQPFTTAQVVDYSFVEKARRELSTGR